MREAHDIVAVCVSDIHLSHQPPLARSGEGNWYDAQARVLDALRDCLESWGKPPLFIAGDIFHKWNPPPELINFAIQHLSPGYAVPGQHDLPHHNYGDKKRSAYWTLVAAGVLQDLPPGVDVTVGADIYATGFPWGYPPLPVEADLEHGRVDLAVVHAYCWTEGRGFPGAPEDRRVGAYRKGLIGYTHACFGDNHTPFDASVGGCRVANCGAFIPRKASERATGGTVVRIWADGRMDRKQLTWDTEIDSWQDVPQEVELGQAINDAMRDYLSGLAEQAGVLDFTTEITNYLTTAGTAVTADVRAVLAKAMETIR